MALGLVLKILHLNIVIKGHLFHPLTLKREANIIFLDALLPTIYQQFL